MAGFFNWQDTQRIETFVKSRTVASQKKQRLKDESASFWGNNRCLFREIEETN
jgi:hypothetical protein